MEAKKQSELAKKYWEGQSTNAEEKALLNSALNGVAEREKTHFKQLQQFSKLSLDATFEADLMDKISVEKSAISRQLIPSMVWKVAAAVLIGLSSYFLYQPMSVVEETTQLADLEEEDPAKAFEVTKQALLLISAKLNKASKVDLPLDKFEETRVKIQEKEG
ncbi:MAG: hypothetical protein AB8G86_27865 [Saprospiraceae bacterium]